jgi:hypothetical protein
MSALIVRSFRVANQYFLIYASKKRESAAGGVTAPRVLSRLYLAKKLPHFVEDIPVEAVVDPATFLPV